MSLPFFCEWSNWNTNLLICQTRSWYHEEKACLNWFCQNKRSLANLRTFDLLSFKVSWSDRCSMLFNWRFFFWSYFFLHHVFPFPNDREETNNCSALFVTLIKAAIFYSAEFSFQLILIQLTNLLCVTFLACLCKGFKTLLKHILFAYIIILISTLDSCFGQRWSMILKTQSHFFHSTLVITTQ